MKKLFALLIVFLPFAAITAEVETVESVETYVNIRSAPDAGADVIGRLQRGIPLPYVDSVPGWHEVLVSEGLTGFVSADWSRVITDAPATEPAAETEPTPEPPAQVEPPSEPATEAEPTPEPAAEVEPTPEPAADVEPAPVPAPEAEPMPLSEAEVEPTQEPARVARPIDTESMPEPSETAAINGRPGFLVRFKEPTLGTNSIVFDDGNNIGIGTTDPQQRLEVNGSIRINEQNSSVAGLLITQSSGETGYLMHNRASTLTIGAGSVDRITIDRDGNVGIGVARPSHPLELANGAYVSAGGVWTNNSSRRAKRDIVALSADDAMAALSKLEPVQFRYADESSEDYLGFIAEDVPELVATGSRTGLSSMDIVAVLTRVIQTQQRRIEALESRLDALE